MTTVVAVVGTIAGAGATTTVAALGTALGEQRRRVALVDATAAGSRIADALEVDGGGDLADALRRGTAVPDVQGSGPHDVAAFPAAPETSWGSIRPDAVATLYDQLRERFEFVLVDCGSDLSPARGAWLGHADEAVVVTDPDVAGAVPETAALAGAFDVPVRGVLANRVPPKEVGDAVDVLYGTELAVLAVLPEDPTVGLAADAGDSVLRTEPDSMIATAAWELALRFRQRDHDEPVVPAGTSPRPSADADETTSGADETRPEDGESAPGDGDPTAGADDPTSGEADRDAGRADAMPGGSAGTTSAEPAPPADDASASPEAATGTDDPQPAEPAGSSALRETGDSTTDDSGDRPDGSESEELGTSAADEDPFTSPEPRAVEDDAEAADAEGGASGSAPSGSLLGDVRAHIGERRPDDRATGSGTGDGSGADETTDPGPSTERIGPDPADETPDLGAVDDGSDRDPAEDAIGGDPVDDAPDPGGDSVDSDPSRDGTDDDGTGSLGSSSGSIGDESHRDADADGSDEGAAALSDEEIESLFAETMERVQGRRESESVEPEDGTAGDDEEKRDEEH